MKLGRRRFLTGGAAAMGLGIGGEWWSLRGSFDHRRSPGEGGPELYADSLRRIDKGEEGVLHVGHSTHLIALGGLRLLTDPWFYDPAFGALSHVRPPAVVPSKIGRLDVILVSHDHADHVDLRAMAELDRSAAVIVSTEELAKKVRSVGFGAVSILAVGEKRAFGPLDVTAVEAVHDIYEIGFVVERRGEPRGPAARSVYFAGDTAMNPAIERIGRTFEPTLSILPCDGTRLAGGPPIVMTPADAVEAAKRLGSRIVLPSHAEAHFSDPIAGGLLASMSPRPRESFLEGVARELRGRTSAVGPAPGDLVVL